MRFKIAIIVIGCGKTAQKHLKMYQALQNEENIKVSAVVDVNLRKS